MKLIESSQIAKNQYLRPVAAGAIQKNTTNDSILDLKTPADLVTNKKRSITSTPFHLHFNINGFVAHRLQFEPRFEHYISKLRSNNYSHFNENRITSPIALMIKKFDVTKNDTYSSILSRL